MSLVLHCTLNTGAKRTKIRKEAFTQKLTVEDTHAYPDWITYTLLSQRAEL